MNFLSDRTPRERYLILGALGLAAVMGLWLFVFKPLSSYTSSAKLAQTSAARDLEIVQSGVSRLTQPSNRSRKAFNRSAAINAARQHNLSISRMQPESNGALKIWFEDTQATSVYNFLADIDASYEATISTVQMNRRSDGQVSANIMIKPNA